MTDLEFYQKALSFQSWLVNRISEIKAYGKHWSDEFCLKEIRNATEKYFTDDNVKEVFYNAWYKYLIEQYGKY